MKGIDGEDKGGNDDFTKVQYVKVGGDEQIEKVQTQNRTIY